jgi:dTDP-4-amino-4,6-dideoxygalactose transaminase
MSETHKADERFIPFFKPSFTTEEEDAVIRVIRSGWLTTGSEAIAFEKEFASFIGSDHCLAVNSASSGLMLAMDAFGVGVGTKILTTPYTFVSTATSARHLGAEVAYADLARGSYSIDPGLVDAALARDASIRAIVPVHIAGCLCDMDALREIGRRRGVKIIEDAAHSFPSRTKDGFAGTLGDAGVFSFYATKTITTGEGGMVSVRDAEATARIRVMRSHGIDRNSFDRYTSKQASWKYDVIEEGWKCNLPDVLAAIGRVQLIKADEFFNKRSRIARMFNEAFSAYDFFELPPDGEGNAWHLYLLRIVPEKLDCDRDVFAQELQDAGLGISMHFIPHFEMTWCKKRYGLTRADFPEATKQYLATVTLPFWPDMDDETINRVTRIVIDTAKKHLAKKAAK